MRLRRLAVEHYGCFERADLRLAVEPGCINLVVAPNGAGKSVLRQAFHDLLFDIPMQSPMQFRFGYKGMRLHAEAVATDGVAFEFGWTRGAKPQRVTNDPVRYAALRAETSPDQLEQLFALDTGRLRKGGIDLRGGATLAAALLSGTGELASARKVQAELDGRRAANWGARQSRPPLNAAISALERTQKAARAAVQRPQYREQQEQELEAARKEHEAAREEAGRAQLAQRRLNRIALTRPHLEALTRAQEWFAAHPAAPALPAGLEERLAEGRSQVARAKAILDEATEAVERALMQAGKIPGDEGLAPHEAGLSRLSERLGEAEKAAYDIVGVRAKRASARDDVAAALRDVGAQASLELASTLVPTVGVVAATRAAIRAHAGLLEACSLGDSRLEEERRRVHEAGLDPVLDTPAPEGLAALLREIRADRNPVQHAASTVKARLVSQAALDAEVAKVPGWVLGAEAMVLLSPPMEAACERLDLVRTEAAGRARDDKATVGRLETEQSRMRAELSELQARSLPDDAAIAAARAERDRGWRLVARRAFSGTPDLVGELAYAGDVPLPLAFERDLRAADALADLRVTELERVERAERLVRECRAIDEQIELARKVAAASREAEAAAWRAWEQLVGPVGLNGGSTIGELRTFVAARLRVVDAMHALRLATDEALAVAGRHADWAGRLAGLLQEPGGSEEPQQALQTLLLLGDARIEAAEASRQARVLQAEKLKTARAALRAAEQAQQAARDRMDAWGERWRSILFELGRPVGEDPVATAAVLDRLMSLEGHINAVAGFDERIKGMQDSLDRFEADVCALAEALQEPVIASAFEMARALSARWSHAAVLASARRQAEDSLQQSREAQGRAEEQDRAARRELDAVIAAAGALDEEGAAERIGSAREYARHAAMRDEAEAKLGQYGEDVPLDALRRQAELVPAEEMAAERDRAEEAVRAVRERLERAAVQVSERERAFDADAESTSALAAAGEHAAAAAAFARLLDEQLVLQLASSMLRRAMQFVEQDAGDRGLARISEAFGLLTEGAYGVVLDEEDGSTLYAMEHRFPNERKKLDQLSEGTRDQLYLALRMVALREHAAAASPLPFIADDILQTFDDRRANAALVGLTELSDKLQVIVLTHHEHLAGLAAALPANKVNVQRLA